MIRRLLADFQIVVRYFARVAGIEAYSSVPVFFVIRNRGDELTIDVKVHLEIPDPHLNLVQLSAGADRGSRSPINYFGFSTRLMQDHLVLRIGTVVNQKTVVLQLAVFLLALN